MKDNTAVKAYHFEVKKKGRIKINPKEYYWYLPECMRKESLKKGDVVLVSAESKDKQVIISEVLQEDDEAVKDKHRPVIQKTDEWIEVDLEKVKAIRAANRAAMEKKIAANIIKKAARAKRLQAEQEALEKRKAEEAASGVAKGKGKKKAAKEPEKAASKPVKPAAPKPAAQQQPKPSAAADKNTGKKLVEGKLNQFDRIKAHLHNKLNEPSQDSAQSRSRQKKYNDYINWLAPRQEEIRSGALQYADAADEIAKITGVRIGKKN